MVTLFVRLCASWLRTARSEHLAPGVASFRTGGSREAAKPAPAERVRVLHAPRRLSRRGANQRSAPATDTAASAPAAAVAEPSGRAGQADAAAGRTHCCRATGERRQGHAVAEQPAG